MCKGFRTALRWYAGNRSWSIKSKKKGRACGFWIANHTFACTIRTGPLSVSRDCTWNEVLTCFMKISLSRLCPQGLYFRLNLSNRWKMFLSACTSSVSTLRSFPVSCSDWKTSESVRYFPSRKITISSGSLRSFDLMKRNKCFWCMQEEWWTCVSTCPQHRLSSDDPMNQEPRSCTTATLLACFMCRHVNCIMWAFKEWLTTNMTKNGNWWNISWTFRVPFTAFNIRPSLLFKDSSSYRIQDLFVKKCLATSWFKRSFTAKYSISSTFTWIGPNRRAFLIQWSTHFARFE